jgi:basic amino acid/polyamine antiporter, APA family
MSDRKLKRTMGMWMATALVIGNMVGSGIFLLPASLSSAAGPVSIIGWVSTGVGAMLLALVFARLGGTFSRTGGPYVTEPELFERRLFVRDVLIAALAFGYSVWAITGSGKDIIAKGFVLLLAGIPVYVYMGWRKRKDAEELEEAFTVSAPATEMKFEVSA